MRGNHRDVEHDEKVGADRATPNGDGAQRFVTTEKTKHFYAYAPAIHGCSSGDHVSRPDHIGTTDAATKRRERFRALCSSASSEFGARTTAGSDAVGVSWRRCGKCGLHRLQVKVLKVGLIFEL